LEWHPEFTGCSYPLFDLSLAQHPFAPFQAACVQFTDLNHINLVLLSLAIVFLGPLRAQLNP
jgi:hypothetical protein